MKKRIISMVIDNKGNVEVDFDGYPGKACAHEEQKLREILGDLGLEIGSSDISAKKDHSGPAAGFTDKRKIGL